MRGIIDFTVRLIRAGKRAYAKKWSFFGLFVFVFLASIIVLGKLDLLPEMSPARAAAGAASSPNVTVNASKVTEVVELPIKVEISSINLSAAISNPTTVDIAILDQALLKGAVRYPTSSQLGEVGNVVLFGHSSYLPVVGNQAYKTFNGIQKLVAGEEIIVYSSGMAYTYQVRSVAKENAKSDEGIPLEVSGRVLTLVTCNSFGTKEDRFIVTADFVESHPAGI
ncbi:sortase [Candidatus Kaiserbacteria bacterium]|nr:sortase [Candidatus Kaiserbacteria bacterium]